MDIAEKKQIYLDRFPAIIGKRMAGQFNEEYFEKATKFFEIDDYTRNIWIGHYLNLFESFSKTNEGYYFWMDIFELYHNEIIEHQQILDIFHKHNIKP